ncbi:Yip1 family protein [Ruegeria sp.]|uniref:Yip1 family protein n=1 Tax=Ruegeria sp. TaxID=1879320 RepID=UPI003B597885
MNIATFGNLAVQTVTNPADTARYLLSVRPKREVLWLAFFLAVVLRCLLQVLMSQILPGPAGSTASGPDSIALSLVWFAGIMLFSIVAFFLFGRLLRGVASFDDVFALMIWVQFLQIAVLLPTIILAAIVPALFLMIALATAVLSFYVTLHFLNEAHKFGTLWKSFGVILLSAFAAMPFVFAFTPSGPV